MRRNLILLVWLIGLMLTACSNDQATPSNADALTLPTSTVTTPTPLSPSQAAPQTFSGQNTITLANGSSATYQFSLSHPPGWTAAPGEVSNFISNRDPMPFPMQSGATQLSFSFRPFMPPDLTTLEQALPGAPTTPISLAGYAGLRADFSDQAATHSEGSTILLQVDADAFLFITLQVAYGERASLEAAALNILNSLTVTRAD